MVASFCVGSICYDLEIGSLIAGIDHFKTPDPSTRDGIASHAMMISLAANQAGQIWRGWTLAHQTVARRRRRTSPAVPRTLVPYGSTRKGIRKYFRTLANLTAVLPYFRT